MMLLGQEFSREIRPSEPRMYGKDIIKIQEMLLSFGFSEVGTVDGWYGPKTEAAVRKYQEFLGFLPTGIVNKGVWETLSSKNSLVRQIHSDLVQVNLLAKEKYEKIEKDLPDHSTEGGSITKYLDSGKAKYIEIELYFEMGKVYYKVYPIENRYIVVSTAYRYPKPFDLENANIEYASYYYTGKATYEITNGLPTRLKYDATGILEILDEEKF